MFYLYRFLNEQNEVLYVGKTSNISKRIDKEHFSSNGSHLPLSCYKETSVVEYATVNTEAEQSIYEIFLINKYRPPYNTQFKYDDSEEFSFKLPQLEWAIYKVILKDEKKRRITLSDEVFLYRESRLKLYEKFLDLDLKIRDTRNSIKDVMNLKLQEILINSVNGEKRTINKDEYELICKQVFNFIDELCSCSADIVTL